MNTEQEAFRYRYSAKEQEEIRQIRDKYLPEEETKMEQLRRWMKARRDPAESRRWHWEFSAHYCLASVCVVQWCGRK
ncbi:MAG: hypothetical protein NC254_06215 [bacterium]|nr:hypothetical protein [bacterium]